MNLYRLLYINKHDSRLLERDRLFESLNNKEKFTLDDLNGIRSFQGLHPLEGLRNYSTADATKNAFAEPDMHTKLRGLKKIRGVGTVLASHILSFWNPYKYAGLSHKVWNTLVREFEFNAEEKKGDDDFSVQEFEEYLKKVSSLAVEYGMKPADVEFVLSNLLEKKIA